MPNATEAVNANPRSARKKHSINESMGRFAMVRRQIAQTKCRVNRIYPTFLSC